MDGNNERNTTFKSTDISDLKKQESPISDSVMGYASFIDPYSYNGAIQSKGSSNFIPFLDYFGAFSK